MVISDPATTLLSTLQLPLLRLRLSLRFLEDAVLPIFKGALLRGGFGYAFQRASCPQPCWHRSEQCAVGTVCPYRWIFETPRPTGVAQLHDLQDIPRPFVVQPPLDGQTHYPAGSALEFSLVLIGRGIEYLPYFLYGFEQLGSMGLGRSQAKFRLERVEALRPWQPFGTVIYQDGRVTAIDQQHAGYDELALYDSSALRMRAAQLPSDLRLILRTPLRVKARGAFIEQLELAAIVQNLCWRVNSLSIFHSTGPWEMDHRSLVEQARAIEIQEAHVRWQEWTRTSGRGGQEHTMEFGGLVGSAVLRNVPQQIREVLLLGGLVHVGKAAVFGNGLVELVAV